MAFDQGVADAPVWLKDLRKRHGGVQVYAGNILDKGSLIEAIGVFQAEALVNLAAKPGVAQAEDEPAQYEQVNVRGLEIVFEACAEMELTRIVHASSSSVYGLCAGQMDEHQPIEPLGQYGQTKARGEYSIRAACEKQNLNVRILRPFTLMGPLGRPDMAPWKFARKIAKGQSIQIHNGARRDFTSVHDVAMAFALAVETDWQGCEEFNIGSEVPHEAEELARLLAKSLGQQLRTEHVDLPAYMPQSTWSNSAKARQRLGWRPKVSFAAAVEEFATWYIKQPDL